MPIHRIEWNKLYSRLSNGREDVRWKQGEHLSIIGTTGAGKSYLGLRLLPIRDYTVAFGTKPRDSTLSSYIKKERYRRVTEWEPIPASDRIVVWPPYQLPDDELLQYYVFRTAMRQMFSAGSWTLFIDEINYFAGRDSTLKLDRDLRAYWQQGRSIGISFMGATQRPYNVPQLMFSMPSHLFFFRFTDENDLKRIGGIGWLNRKDIWNAVANLEKYHFLYICRDTGELYISKVE